MGKFERRRQLIGADRPGYYNKLVNPYFISLSKQVRLCPECHSRTVIEPAAKCPNLAMEICTNEECNWSQGMMPPKSMLVPDGYGLPGYSPSADGEASYFEYEGPSPMQMVFRHNAAVAAAEQARYGTGAPDPELEELERIESEGDEPPLRKKAKVLRFRPGGPS